MSFNEKSLKLLILIEFLDYPKPRIPNSFSLRIQAGNLEAVENKHARNKGENQFIPNVSDGSSPNRSL